MISRKAYIAGKRLAAASSTISWRCARKKPPALTTAASARSRMLLRTDLLRQDAENSEPEMAARSAQFLPGGAIPLDGRSMIRNALNRGGQLLEELEALS